MAEECLEITELQPLFMIVVVELSGFFVPSHIGNGESAQIGITFFIAQDFADKAIFAGGDLQNEGKKVGKSLALEATGEKLGLKST